MTLSVSEVRKHVVDFIQDAVKEGKHPRDIRRYLQKIGVRWRYQSRHQGEREKQRRLRQQSLCTLGCGRWTDWTLNPTCFDCRADIWRE